MSINTGWKVQELIVHRGAKCSRFPICYVSYRGASRVVLSVLTEYSRVMSAPPPRRHRGQDKLSHDHPQVGVLYFDSHGDAMSQFLDAMGNTRTRSRWPIPPLYVAELISSRSLTTPFVLMAAIRADRQAGDGAQSYRPLLQVFPTCRRYSRRHSTPRRWQKAPILPLSRER